MFGRKISEIFNLSLEKGVSLKAKFTAIMIVIVVVILIISTFLRIKISETVLEKELKKRAIFASKEVISVLDSPRTLEKLNELDDELDLIMVDQKEIEQIDIFILDGTNLKLLVTSEDSGVTSYGPEEYNVAKTQRNFTNLEEKDGSRFWQVIYPFHTGKKGKDNIKGIVRVRASLKEVDRIAKERRELAAVITFFTILMMVVLLSIFVDILINKPIKKLVEGMSRVEKGDWNARVELKGKDEFAKLANNYNRMIMAIEESYSENQKLVDQIHKFNEELKSKIVEATKELAFKNEELMKINELLFKTQRELAHMEKLAAVGQISATVAHEVGTPLNSISGHLQLLKEEECLTESMINRVNIVESQVKRVVDTIVEILNLTKPPKLKMIEVHLNEVINEMLKFTSPGFSVKNIKIISRFDNNLKPIMGEPHQLQQVLLNLISNSIEAVPYGGTISIRTFSETSNGEGWIKISIYDNGTGINKDNINKIFEPFFTTKSRVKGTGLGLSVCKEIISQHKGNIQVFSEEGKGTEFVISLPEKRG